jgi:hypothetical protein
LPHVFGLGSVGVVLDDVQVPTRDGVDGVLPVPGALPPLLPALGVALGVLVEVDVGTRTLVL